MSPLGGRPRFQRASPKRGQVGGQVNREAYTATSRETVDRLVSRTRSIGRSSYCTSPHRLVTKVMKGTTDINYIIEAEQVPALVGAA